MPSETTPCSLARVPSAAGAASRGLNGRPRDRSAVRSAVTAALLATAGAPGLLFADTSLDLRVEASYTADDDVNRAPSSDALRDRIYGLQSRRWPSCRSRPMRR